MSYNVIQHPRHNILSQFHVDKYLYKKKTQWKWLSASPLNREALTGEIIGLKSTGMSCFVYTPGDLHSSHPFPLSPLLAVLSISNLFLSQPSSKPFTSKPSLAFSIAWSPPRLLSLNIILTSLPGKCSWQDHQPPQSSDLPSASQALCTD